MIECGLKIVKRITIVYPAAFKECHPCFLVAFESSLPFFIGLLAVCNFLLLAYCFLPLFLSGTEFSSWDFCDLPLATHFQFSITQYPVPSVFLNLRTTLSFLQLRPFHFPFVVFLI